MIDPHNSGLRALTDEGRKEAGPESRPRAVGSPLPVGSGTPLSQPDGPGESLRPYAPPPPGRGLNNGNGESIEVPTGVQRAVSALRAALPFVQKILPLLEGNIVGAVSNMLTPHHHQPPPAPPAPPVNLAPLEDGLAEMKTQQREIQIQQRELRSQLIEQNSSMKRVEDQLEMVREATDRNTLEQQELLEDLKVVGNKVNLFAMIALGLLGLSVILNIVLYLHILRVLP